ncbi:transcriptional protein SWT1 [Drosophila sechellia]|uniref:GM22837 n=1 Tax=Drosophila sechellia TaxID=7238 RepID=B4I6N2_DROSE|nr:transcriptional protein SWT1 [Drosophila sechellia]EDW55980.1 GM22837 [Drosophila sechellia]
MSLGGESKHTPKLSNLRLLDDDQLVRIVRTPRPSNGLGQHPAQDRLKRLQAQLKRMQDNEKEQGTTNRSTHSSLAARRSCASTSTPQRILKVPAKVARNAWEKPKALVDANRLKAGRSQPANQRLMLLRASLQQKQQCEERNNNIVPKINEEVIEKQPEICNITNTSAFGSTASDMEVEPMEWQDSIEEEATQKNQDEAKEGDDTLLMLQAESIEEEAPQKDQDETKEEDDTLLMLQAADAEELPPRLVDYMYFVLDTNVLIHNHKFVERLTDVVLPGTVGSMLYLPYIVIKELDKLKYKYESDCLKRVIAVRAIRFLNTKFDESLQIQAQSALEEADHLIKIDCPDDSIVNCCLQLQEQVPHMMLLTNDANLRLKANASDIKVSSRSALMSTYADEFAGFGD